MLKEIESKEFLLYTRTFLAIEITHGGFSQLTHITYDELRNDLLMNCSYAGDNGDPRSAEIVPTSGVRVEGGAPGNSNRAHCGAERRVHVDSDPHIAPGPERVGSGRERVQPGAVRQGRLQGVQAPAGVHPVRVGAEGLSGTEFRDGSAQDCDSSNSVQVQVQSLAKL